MNNSLDQLNDVMAMIAEAREAVSSDEMVDLTEIQARVHNICIEIQETPPVDSPFVEAKITTMIKNLNALAKELEVQQRNLGSDVVRNAVRKAYAKPKGDV